MIQFLKAKYNTSISFQFKCIERESNYQIIKIIREGEGGWLVFVPLLESAIAISPPYF
jgi:hypothetical protein